MYTYIYLRTPTHTYTHLHIHPHRYISLFTILGFYLHIDPMGCLDHIIEVGYAYHVGGNLVFRRKNDGAFDYSEGNGRHLFGNGLSSSSTLYNVCKEILL